MDRKLGSRHLFGRTARRQIRQSLPIRGSFRIATMVFEAGKPPARLPDPPVGGGNMKKMSIRKAGTIRLTSASYYCPCALA